MFICADPGNGYQEICAIMAIPYCLTRLYRYFSVNYALVKLLSRDVMGKMIVESSPWQTDAPGKPAQTGGWTDV
jgi:hypothetical protein